MPEYRMRVFRYFPAKLYGFCQDDEGGEFFFHLSVFQPGEEIETVRCGHCPGAPRCLVDAHPPPPILGEPVLVTGDGNPSSRPAPRAARVERIQAPRMMLGTVESFFPDRRYGFVQGPDQMSYHLHDSEVVDGRFPTQGAPVVFYPGFRQDRPRACYVKVCR